jgi:hypothetical protein
MVPPHVAPYSLQQFHPEVAKDGLTKVPAVQCQPLSAIMTQLGIQHINFFVLDVEGTHQGYSPLLIPFATFTALSLLDTKPNLAFASQAVL